MVGEHAKLVILKWACQGLLSISQIGVFFNLLYLLTGLVFDFDFLETDRHQ